jgi:S-adenosylmethionine-diacylglycerol 3-amino-3-carboxypropyl transferase
MRRTTAAGLSAAVHRNKSLSQAGLLERLFTLAFRGLVYPQIWEDPAVDMAALALRPTDHLVTIASGGCNVLSYLADDPAQITAIDLNGAHIALNRLKLCAAKHLPDYESFFRFFGRADSKDNIAAYDQYIRPHLDPISRAYWEGRILLGARRIEYFSKNFYRYGLLGNFIGVAHGLGRLYGCDPRSLLKARSREEQCALFESDIAPIFEKRFVRWLVGRQASLYGLGIPPSQYVALARDDGDGKMVNVLRERLRRLACDFDLSTNYFAWQAFARGYEDRPDPATPPYLERSHFDALRERCDRVEVRHISFADYLESRAKETLDAYVLLDAQDWMTDEGLTRLWREITRTARPGARVIFRTAADERLLPGRVPAEILSHWIYDAGRCRTLARQDRSSIYGGFHLYVKADA